MEFLVYKGSFMRFGFQSNKNIEQSNFSKEDSIQFYNMLLKMKKKHPNLNIKRIMTKLYPELRIEKLIKDIL